jgi:hypothetical protein
VAVNSNVHGDINHIQQSGVINLASGNTFGQLGDLMAGDKVAGGKVSGAKSIHYGTPKTTDTGPEHIHTLIDMHTRRLRILEQ